MSAIINGKGFVGIRGGAVVGSPVITQFITTWKTDNAGTSTSTQIIIPTTGSGYACTVDWGDGTTDTYSGTAPVMLHTYPSAGTYTVKISGTFPRIGFNNTGDILKLLTIENWGTGVWSGSMGTAFYGCANLKINAQDVPNFAGVTNTSTMFQNCTSLTNVNASGWNLSSCITFGGAGIGMFGGCTNLKDINVSNWVLNTTSNTSMSNTFRLCSSLSAITGLNTWNTSKVTDTSSMFNSCTSLSSLDLSNWNLSSCTNFGNTTTTGMFLTCTNLKDINVSNWLLNTTSNITMYGVFRNCTSLTGITGLNTWNTSKVTDTSLMFNICSSLSSLDLSNWNMSANTSTSNMFTNCSNLKDINVSNWILNTTSNIIMTAMFGNCTALSGITGINNWNTSKVTNTNSMFLTCNSLSSLDLSNWNLSACTTTASMFAGCSLLKSVNATNFDLRNNTTMLSMFGNCTALSGITGINNWNTSKVTNTNQMFLTCNSLSSLDLSNWNLSACTNFSSMFNVCNSLTGLTVSNWNLSTSTGTSINMSGMFNGMGTKTITGLNTWNIARVTNLTNFLLGTTLDTTTYSNMLIAWDALDPVNSLTFNGGSSKYNAAGQTARQSLITNDLWSITDGGLQA